MCVVKSGQHKFSASIDHTCPGPAPAVGVRIRPNRHNPIPQHGNRLRRRMCSIDRPDLRVTENKVRGRLRLRGTQAGKNQDKQEKQAQSPMTKFRFVHEIGSLKRIAPALDLETLRL